MRKSTTTMDSKQQTQFIDNVAPIRMAHASRDRPHNRLNDDRQQQANSPNVMPAHAIRGAQSSPGICRTSHSCTRPPFLSRIPPTAQSGASLCHAIPAAHTVSPAQPVPSGDIPRPAGAPAAIHISLLPLPLLSGEDVPLLVRSFQSFPCAARKNLSSLFCKLKKGKEIFGLIHLVYVECNCFWNPMALPT